MFCKKVVLTISGESLEVTWSFSIMLKKSFWSSSLLIQLLFRYYSSILLWLHFRFPRALIFQNISFSHPFMVAGLGITRTLTRWETVVLLIRFTFLGCFKVSRILDKHVGHDAYGIKQNLWSNTLRGSVPGLAPEIYVTFHVP